VKENDKEQRIKNKQDKRHVEPQKEIEAVRDSEE